MGGRARIALLWVFLAVQVHQLSAQEAFTYSQAAEQEFSLALGYFDKGMYQDAYGLFDSLAAREPVHQKTTAAYVMAGKSLYGLRRYRESSTLLVTFLKTFPETRYAGDGRYTLALDYLMLQLYDQAALQCMRSIEATNDTVLAARARRLFEMLSEERLDATTLRQLLLRATKTEVRDLVTLMLAEKLYRSGDGPGALALLDPVLARGSGSSYATRMQSLHVQLLKSRPLTIGVMLPLLKDSPLNPIQSMARDILDGMQFALAQRPKDQAPPIYLEIRDTRRDSAAAIQAVRELSESPEVIAIIGPVFSSHASICAPIANKHALALLTPTATANGIAEAGPFVFQLNPDMTVRGVAMARYAVQDLGFTTLAILSTQEEAGKLLAESFAREAVRLGAAVVVQESYAPGASDLRDQFLAIREAGMKLQDRKGQTDDLETPVTSIQGLYVPVVNPEDIGVIAPQLSYFNVKAQLLGGGEWYVPAELEAHKRYIDGAVFASDFYVDRDDSTYFKFEQAFSRELHREPSSYVLFGYDAMNLLLRTLTGGPITRASVAAALSSVDGFKGLHSRITLTRGRVNSEIQILRFSNGTVTKITEINVR